MTRLLRRPTDPKLTLLRDVASFATARDRDLQTLATLVDVVAVDQGATLIRQGGSAEEFFVIVEGSARIERDGVVVGIADAGDVLGEAALLHRVPRNATVIAATPMRVLVGSRSAFDAVRDLMPRWAAAVAAVDEDRVPADA